MTTPSTAVAPVLSVTGARRAFGGRAALCDVTLAVAPGEIYALLGPNGAGKTTLIRSICGQVRLDSGAVRVAGADPRSQADARRTLGLVPQEIALYPQLTVRENLMLLGQLAGLALAPAAARVDEALSWIDLADRQNDQVSTLSGGMKRRVNIAAGLLHHPAIVLLDEPTVGVDPQARLKIHEMLQTLRERGIGILLTTHDLEQASELADRIGVLDEGRLLAEGPLARLVHDLFGDQRRLSLRLSAPATTSTREPLAACGLTSTADDQREWSGTVSGGLGSLDLLQQQLAATGATISDIALASPDLHDVFFKLTGKELRE